MAVAEYQEVKPWAKDHILGMSIFIATTIFIQLFTANCQYWLFGLKYWVISIEVPYIIEEEQREFDPNQEVVRQKRLWTEKKY